jgi:hypothetical protein
MILMKLLTHLVKELNSNMRPKRLRRKKQYNILRTSL